MSSSTSHGRAARPAPWRASLRRAPSATPATSAGAQRFQRPLKSMLLRGLEGVAGRGGGLGRRGRGRLRRLANDGRRGATAASADHRPRRSPRRLPRLSAGPPGTRCALGDSQEATGGARGRPRRSCGGLGPLGRAAWPPRRAGGLLGSRRGGRAWQGGEECGGWRGGGGQERQARPMRGRPPPASRVLWPPVLRPLLPLPLPQFRRLVAAGWLQGRGSVQAGTVPVQWRLASKGGAGGGRQAGAQRRK